MASPPSPPENGDQPEFTQDDSSEKPSSSPHHKMSPRNRALFFVTAWLIVLMPFLFWWNTWFGRELPHMLHDSSPMVRGNAALSLVRFRDATGRPQIVALLQPAKIVTPFAGRVTDSDKVGTAIH